jgi:hypothetical protein
MAASVFRSRERFDKIVDSDLKLEKFVEGLESYKHIHRLV